LFLNVRLGGCSLALFLFAKMCFFPLFGHLGNKPHFQSLLQSLVHYISSGSLAADQRAGFIVINKLVSIWLPATADSAQAGSPPIEPPTEGFDRFVYDNVVKLCFDIPLRKDFDTADAEATRVRFLHFCLAPCFFVVDKLDDVEQVMGEMATFLKTLQSRRGSEFLHFMANVFLPSINCPPETAQLLLNELVQSPECVCSQLHFGSMNSLISCVGAFSGRQYKKPFIAFLESARQAAA
jgi:hypothetical protein